MKIEGVNASVAYSAYSAPSADGVSTARSPAAGAVDKPACDCLACAGCKAQGGLAIQNGQGGGGGLNAQGSPEEQAQIQKLKAIDQKVREHEAAHQAAGAGLTGGASYQYVRGPDGKQYAVAGEVSIDASPAGTPEATLTKAKQIRAAALAPADPSAQDQAVAAAAALMESQARAEIAAKSAENEEEGGGNATAGNATGGNAISTVKRLIEAYLENQDESNQNESRNTPNTRSGSRLSVFA